MNAKSKPKRRPKTRATVNLAETIIFAICEALPPKFIGADSQDEICRRAEGHRMAAITNAALAQWYSSKIRKRSK